MDSILGGPKWLKPHGISTAGLRMLLPHMVDETGHIVDIGGSQVKLKGTKTNLGAGLMLYG